MLVSARAPTEGTKGHTAEHFTRNVLDAVLPPVASILVIPEASLHELGSHPVHLGSSISRCHRCEDENTFPDLRDHDIVDSDRCRQHSLHDS